MASIYYYPPNDNGYDPYKGLGDEERIKAGCLQMATIVALFFFGLLLGALFSSCTTTKYVPVETVRTDTTYISKHQRDSIWLHDSIYMKEYQQGDTIYVLRDRWHTKYVEKQVRDTTYIHQTDSIPKPYPVEVKVPRELTWWQRIRIYAGGIALSVLGIWLVFKAWKIYTLRKYL